MKWKISYQSTGCNVTAYAWLPPVIFLGFFCFVMFVNFSLPLATGNDVEQIVSKADGFVQTSLGGGGALLGASAMYLLPAMAGLLIVIIAGMLGIYLFSVMTVAITGSVALYFVKVGESFSISNVIMFCLLAVVGVVMTAILYKEYALSRGKAILEAIAYYGLVFLTIF